MLFTQMLVRRTWTRPFRQRVADALQMSIRTNIHMHTRMHSCMSVCMPMRISTSMSVYTRVHTHDIFVGPYVRRAQACPMPGVRCHPSVHAPTVPMAPHTHIHAELGTLILGVSQDESLGCVVHGIDGLH